MAEFRLPKKLTNQAEVNCVCDRLTKALQETILQVVPTTKVCPFLKRWWTKELKELRKHFRKTGRKSSKHRNTPEHTVHAEFKVVCKQYDKAIKFSKWHHWQDWLERATELDIWTANKYITAPTSDRGKTRILALKQQIGELEVTASTNQSKSKMLARVFLPSKPAMAANHSITQEYPEPICGTHKITKGQIRRQLKRLRPFKAPGPVIRPLSHWPLKLHDLYNLDAGEWHAVARVTRGHGHTLPM
jgi:hypothetical protein